MVKNTAASVRQKLLNKSREEKRPLQELLQYYAMERFLYRLSQSLHNSCSTLKGALMLWAMQGPASRPIRDIDMLGHTSNELAAIEKVLDKDLPESYDRVAFKEKCDNLFNSPPTKNFQIVIAKKSSDTGRYRSRNLIKLLFWKAQNKNGIGMLLVEQIAGQIITVLRRKPFEP